jgi:peroxiredoxin
MSQHSIHAEHAGPPAARTSRYTWFLCGVLIALTAVAVVQLLPRNEKDDPQAQLRGDAEEAAVALPLVLSGTPPAQRKPLLLQYVEDGNPGLRYAAVDALGDQRGPEVAAALERAFTDSSSMARQRAMEVLPRVDRERGLRLLLAGLRDEDSWIRESAATQFVNLIGKPGELVDRRAVPMLVRALDDPDLSVTVMAMGALRKLTGQSWRFRNNDPPDRKQAVVRQWRQWWAQNRVRWNVPLAYADAAPIRPRRADPAPAFDLTDIQGRRLRLADLRGRITLLNFWGTWCSPCRMEVPGLARLDREFRDRGLSVIGIAVSEDGGAEGLRRWCGAHGVEYLQALATDRILKDYGSIHDVPVSVLIDGQGRIRYRWDGDRDYATFRAAIERLLKEE